MPRKIIIKKEDIWRCRAANYERYLSVHKRAMQINEHTRKLIVEELQNLPRPTLDIHGAIQRGFAWRVDIHQRIQLEHVEGCDDLYNQIIFFWSEHHWQEYVNAFNALPEPLTDFEMKYSKKQEKVYYEPLGYLVDNLRTTQVQVQSK